MRVTIVESPFNLPNVSRYECARYALWCCKDCDLRGEASFASHLFYTLFIEETKEGRDRGLAYRDEIARRASTVVARYVDLGETPGMYRDIDCTGKIEVRTLTGEVRDAWLSGAWPAGSLYLRTS